MADALELPVRPKSSGNRMRASPGRTGHCLAAMDRQVRCLVVLSCSPVVAVLMIRWAIFVVMGRSQSRNRIRLLRGQTARLPSSEGWWQKGMATCWRRSLAVNQRAFRLAILQRQMIIPRGSESQHAVRCVSWWPFWGPWR